MTTNGEGEMKLRRLDDVSLKATYSNGRAELPLRKVTAA
jgi:hypothetical protein